MTVISFGLCVGWLLGGSLGGLFSGLLCWFLCGDLGGLFRGVSIIIVEFCNLSIEVFDLLVKVDII